MKLEYKYILGEDYYIINDWQVYLRVRLTGVRFDGNNIYMLILMVNLMKSKNLKSHQL